MNARTPIVVESNAPELASLPDGDLAVALAHLLPLLAEPLRAEGEAA